ncbi:wax ester/triacylglycerol synthase family O-acyltransferase [Mycobacterium sp. M1]|uniref:Diacylglycerol O-acyltransferase n=1 Tax=Mycolicibacter acidiphilus TaxID=2835306 RepID=A0ABS5RKP2_9MYCO|nr:wax ester/triacylglycerol synthase family O-acyltransferase [Mycolicibacter acidiphilus]MBS9534865.1 wax ester/triacylglycerol synthase family O-acyltransferase [Mycolicibacter acidiphilus]
MEQLTTLDAGFLEAEDSDRHISLAIGGLVILEGPPPDYGSLLATLSARISECRRFVQKLQLHPLDLVPPRWVDDPDFDIAHHVRRVALPSPGDDAELHRFVADHMARRLDRDRPLWHIWVIEGLTDGRWALLIKVHHCVGDGIAASQLFTGLCDDSGVGSFAGHIHGSHDADSTGFHLSLPSISANPIRWMTDLWNVSTAVGSAAMRAARGTWELSAGLLHQGAVTSLNGPMSAMRRFSAAKVSMDDVKRICAAFDVTLNDVALAALTEGYRGMLTRRGERPEAESMRTLVPVSMRTEDAFGATDNRVSVMLPYLPVEEENPVVRLRLVHSRLTRTKSTGQRQAGSAFVNAANYLPFPLTAWAVRLLTHLPQHGVTTITTNVPGPSGILHIMGHRVLDVLPVPPIALQLRTGVAMLSYADSLFFGILADFDTMPDVDEFAHDVEAAVARLVASSKRRKGARQHRGLTLVASG